MYWMTIKLQHFIQVYLKTKCPIQQTSHKWTSNSTNEAEIWPNTFLDRIQEFFKLSDIEKE